MKILQLLAFGTLVAFSPGTSSLQAAEAHLAVAPHIDLPKDLPLYGEDLSNFYGTALYILNSTALQARTEAQLGHKPPASLVVEAAQIPRTSMLAITVTGVDDATATAYLSAFIDQYLKYEAERKKKGYAEAIQRANAAITNVPKELVASLTAYRDGLVKASLLDTTGYFERTDF